MIAAEIDTLASVILADVPRVRAIADPRIASGELLSPREAHAIVASKLQRLFKELERLSDEAAEECEGKTEDQIRAILLRKFGAVMSQEMQSITAQAL